MRTNRKKWEQGVVNAACMFSERTVELNVDRMKERDLGLVIPFPIEFLENVRKEIGPVACAVLDALETNEIRRDELMS